MEPSRAARLLAPATGSCALGLGTLVAVGWDTGNAALVQVHPSLVPMQYNTALGFALCGLALVAAPRFRRLALACAAIAALLGALTLIEYVAGVDLGIDELFRRHSITVKTSRPGRMAPGTALCFVLAGTALVLQLSERGSRSGIASGALGSLVVSIGAATLVGYAVGLEEARVRTFFTRMAVHTALGFELVGIGVIASAFRSLSPRTTPSPVAIPVGASMLALSLVLWQAAMAHDDAQLRRVLEEEAHEIAAMLGTLIHERVRGLESLARRLGGEASPPTEDWAAETSQYLKDQGIAEILLLDPSLHVLMSRSNRQDRGGVFAAHLERVSPSLERARAEGRTTMSPPFAADAREQVFAASLPLFGREGHQGFLVAVLRLSELLALSQQEESWSRYVAGLAVNGVALPTHPTEDSSFEADWAIATEVMTHGDVGLTLRLWPTEALLSDHSSLLSPFVLGAGLLVSALVTLTAHLGQTVVARRMSLAEDRFTSLAESVPDAVLIVDRQGVILRTNDQAHHLFGYSEAQLTGQCVERLLPERARAPHIEHRARYFTSPATRSMGQSKELYALRADGTEVPVEISLSPLESFRGPLACATIRDVSSRKAAARSIARHAAELARSNEELEQFAYVASHDLKAPLRGIKNLTSWLEEDLKDSLTEESRENMRLVQERVLRMERLLDDLLTYARAGRSEVRVELVDVRELVDGIVVLLSPPSGFAIQQRDELPTFETARVPLEEALRNLIGNAIKHHDRTQGCISIGCEDAGNYFAFSISDDGPGIPTEYQERIFGMFQTLKVQDQVEGSGMGLAMVKKLVELQGGDVFVESSPPQRGATFRLLWPKHWSLEQT